MAERLDVVLVQRGLVRSRAAAQRLIADGAVRVAGDVVRRSAAKVEASVPLDVDDSRHPFVSRAGEKLEHALEAFAIDVAGAEAVDVGSSTGGFTDCMLQRGAASVLAVDVGTGQLAPMLRSDDRVTSLESTDVRSLDPVAAGAPFDIVTCDVSFISLAKVLPALVALGGPETRFVLLVKPQFEVGPSQLDRRGVVRSATVARTAVAAVVAAAVELGLALQGCVVSPLTGTAGNTEYLIALHHGEATGCLSLGDTP